MGYQAGPGSDMGIAIDGLSLALTRGAIMLAATILAIDPRQGESA